MRPCRSGARSSRRPKASKPRTAFFDGSTRVDAQDEDLGPSGLRRLEPLPHARAGGEVVELGGVYGDQVRVRAALGVLAPTEERLAALHERRPPTLGVEADAVARQQPFVDRARDLAGKHVPPVGPTHGMWTKWAIRAAGLRARTSAGTR